MFTIIGIEFVSFKDEENNDVNFTRFYLSYEKESVQGLAIEIIRVGSRVNIDGLSVGDQIDIFYNKYGKVSKIEKIG